MLTRLVSPKGQRHKWTSKNGLSQGQKLALTGLRVPDSLGNGRTLRGSAIS